MKNIRLLKEVKKIFKTHYLLIFILVIAGLLRFLGQNPGFPDNHPDEGISFTTGVYMLYHRLEPNIFYYPAGVPFIQVFFYLIFFVPIALFKLFILYPEYIFELISKGFNFFVQYREVIFGVRDINAMFWSRYVAGFTGLSTVLLVYFLSKKLFNRQTALFAALFLAVNYRHILASHIGLPDVYNGFFSLLSFFTSYLLIEKQTRRRYILAGIAIGLAVSMKYQIFTLIPFAVIHLALFLKTKKIGVIINRNSILTIFISIGVFFLINPYILKNLSEFTYHADLTYRWYQMGIYKFRLYPYFYLFHWGIGELVSIAIVLGLFFMARKSFSKFFLLSSFVMPFFFFLTIYSNGGLYTRNFSTVIPFVVIFAGYSASLLLGYVKKFSWSPVFVVMLVIAVNISSIKNSFLLSYYYSKPWNSDILMQWMDKNLPASVILRNHNLVLSWKNRDQFFSILENKHIDQSDWEYAYGPSSLAEFQAEDVDFVILNDNKLQSVTYWWMGWDADKLIRYSEVPYDYIMNGFFGLSTAELMSYSVHEIYKPWQAMSTGNYIVIKIPPKLKDAGRKIAEFHFDNESNMWRTRGLMNLRPPSFSFVSTIGKNKNGSVAIYAKGEGNTSRISSPAIPIKAGKTYTARGWIKNAAEKLELDRESFLRIDFYKEESQLDALGMSVAVSARAPISNEWVMEEAQGKAPNGTKYMTISFQRVNLPRSVALQDFISYLDDVEVFESESEVVEKFEKLPYINPTIPLEDLYPNSFF